MGCKGSRVQISPLRPNKTKAVPSTDCSGNRYEKQQQHRRSISDMNPYIPLPGHPLVRVEVQSVCQGIARVWYIGDRDQLLAAGVLDEEMLTEWARESDNGSRPRGMERTCIDRYWHNSG